MSSRDRHGRPRALALMAAVAVMVFVPATTAEAKVKTGAYTCHSGDFGFAGTLRIHSQTKYSINGGKKGKLAVKGDKLKFKTGDYKKVWTGEATSSKNIDLYFYGTDDYGMSCGR